MTVVPGRAAWQTLAIRQVASRAGDAWNEHLGVSLYNGIFLMGVFAFEDLGPVPANWYDSHGALLAKHRTESGDMRLPEVFKGRHVVGVHHGNFVGGLQLINNSAMVSLGSLSEEPVRDALRSLEWLEGHAGVVIPQLEEMLHGLHTVRIAYIDSLLAAQGHFDRPTGDHSILLGAEAISAIRRGEEVQMEGQGLLDSNRRLLNDRWLFNERCKGSAVIFIDNGYGQEAEALEAIQVWIDGEEQPKPPGYWD